MGRRHKSYYSENVKIKDNVLKSPEKGQFQFSLQIDF